MANFLDSEKIKKHAANRAVKGGSIYLASNLVNSFIGIATTIVLARLLTPEDFGVIGMAALFTGVASLFVEMGMSSATIQKTDINDSQISNVFWLNIFLSILVCCSLLFFSSGISDIYDEPRLKPVLELLSIVVFVNALGIQHKALIVRKLQFASLSLITLIASILGSIFAIYFAIVLGDYRALVIFSIIPSLVNTLGYWLVCRWYPSRPKRRIGTMSFVKFGGHLTAFQFVSHIARNADNALIGFHQGSQALGLYTRAYSLMMLPTTLINKPLNGVVISLLSRYKGDSDKYNEYYCRIVWLTNNTVAPIVLWLVLVVDNVVPMLFGNEWLFMIPIFYALTPAGMMTASNSVNSWLYISFGHVDRQFRWSLVHLIVNSAAIVIGVNWGAIGVAVSLSIARSILKPLGIAYACVGTPIQPKSIYRILYPTLGVCGAACLTAKFVDYHFGVDDSNFIGFFTKTLLYVGFLLLVFINMNIRARFVFEMRSLVRLYKDNREGGNGSPAAQ